MNNNKINIAIIGCGNCASSLLMGLSYYKDIHDNDELVPGLMHNSIAGYLPSDIQVVLAYDIDIRKVGLPLNKAIFQYPNNTKIIDGSIVLDSFDSKYPIVKMGKILDGFSPHLLEYDAKYRIVISEEKEPTKEDVVNELKRTKCEIILNYCPVGSVKATEFYAECCLEAGVSLINNIPVFIASDTTWANRFQEKGIPVLGDDIKSELGATIVNRTLVQMIEDRGGKVINSWQTNFGGNSDFLNMTDQSRLISKKISKTESISSLIHEKDRKNTYVYAGPNGYIDCLKDNKISYMRIDFRIFGNVDCHIDIKLDVEDSPNSGGVIVDAIRCVKLALDRKIGGVLIGPSAWMMKHPLIQYPDNIARQMTEDFINS